MLKFVLSMVLVLPSAWADCGGLLPTQFVIDRWGPREGLPEERILSITQARNGYLWLATADGLVRFNGKTFQVFGSEDRSPFPSYLRSVYPTPDGNLLTIGFDQRLNIVNGRAVKMLTPGGGPDAVRMIPIREDGGKAWIPTYRGVVAYVEGRLETEPAEPAALVGHINVATPDGKGNLWMGTDDGRLVLVSRGRKAVASWDVTTSPAKAIYDIRVSGGVVWISGTGGLHQLANGKLTAIRKEAVTSLFIDSTGVAWVGSAQGLSCLTNTGETLFGPSTGLVSDLPLGVFEDREGNLWAHFATTGLFRIRRPKFLTWGVAEGLPIDRILAVRKSGSRLWVGTENGLSRMEKSEILHVNLPEERPRIRNLAIDKDGTVWASTISSIDRVDGESLRSKAVKIMWPDPVITTLYSGRDGKLWGLDRKIGVFRIEGDTARPLEMGGLPGRLGSRSQLAETTDGRFWLSSRNDGLFLIEGNRAKLVDPANEIWKTIHAIYPGQDGELWIGFDGRGFGRWRNGELRVFGGSGDGPESHVYYIAEDPLGYFWLGLRNRLLRVRKIDVNDFLDGKRKDVPRQWFDIADGLRSANFGLAFLPASEGPSYTVWIPSLRGLVQVDAAQIARNTLPPPIVIEDVGADGGHLDWSGEQLTVPSTVATLRIYFAATSLTAPTRVQYRRKLVGFDEDWFGPDTGQMASYTNVPPGTYKFRVQASNNDGVWNEEGLSLTVVRLPAFYQTWWFQTAAALLGLAMLGGVVKWRTRSLNRQKADLEERVQRRTAELEHAKQAAEAAATAKADFLAIMSHEIRTPMHGVLGTLELLAGTQLAPEQHEHIDVIRGSSNALLTLLNDVLDLSKLEAGRMRLTQKPFSLRTTITEVTQLLQASAQEKAISVVVSTAGELPQTLLGDEARIRQILFNLAGNAVKFTDCGSVEVTTACARSGEKEWHVQIAIRDTGIGIPADRIPSLFQKFYQIDGSYSRRHGGTGLGLAICQRLAEAMGGSIEVKSQIEQGSEFTLRLQLEESAALALPMTPVKQTLPRFSGRVLQAEDNLVNSRMAESLLKRLGCEVECVINGEQALNRLREAAFDIVFMDLHMPTMDGLEATRLIRETLPASQQPVIVALTANAMEGDRERCMAAGMNGYLAKPFHIDDLVAVLARYLPEAVGTVEPVRTVRM